MHTSWERKQAKHASLSRVAASLINERLVTSNFSDEAIVLSHPNTEELICIHLRQPLNFHHALHASELSGKVTYNAYSQTLVSDGAQLMRIFGTWANLDNVEHICRELENSVDNLERAYMRKRSLTIDSPAIDWEQAIVEGHGMHPWHKCRYPVVGDFETATLHFVALPRVGMTVVGDYDEHIRKIAPVELSEGEIILPVHEIQLPNVKEVFPRARVLPQTITGRPQSSVRTISVPGADFCIKVPLAIKITSIVRTIRPWAITIGHRMDPILHVIEKAAESFGGSLTVVREYAAAASSSEHLGCIIRQSTESIEAQTGDRVIVCAALAEHIQDIWPDETVEGKLGLLRQFCSHLFRAVLPSVLLHGFALQAHMQNLLIRLDPISRTIHGFVVRDLGSYRVHGETFSKSTSLDVDTSWVLTKSDSLQKVYQYILSVVHGDVACMVRALQVGMAGWRVALSELERVIPVGDDLARETWLQSPTCVSRAHLSMQLFGVERECKMTTIPNRFYHCQQE